MLPVRLLAARVLDRTSRARTLRTIPCRRAFQTALRPRFDGLDTTHHGGEEEEPALEDDDDDDADISDLSTDLFYDAFFQPTATASRERVREGDAGRAEVIQETVSQEADEEMDPTKSMRVTIIDEMDRAERSSWVPLPDEHQIPDYGDGIEYHQYNETVFNRLSLPDATSIGYEWQPMVLQCEARLPPWEERNDKTATLPSYPGLAIPVRLRAGRRIVVQDSSLAVSSYSILSNELAAFNNIAATTRFETASREALAKVFVRLFTDSVRPGFYFELYGSDLRGIQLPFSDCNIRMRRDDLAHGIEPFTDSETAEAQEVMEEVYALLKIMPGVTAVHMFDSPAVEVEFVHELAQIKFRVTSYKTASRQNRYLKAVRKRYEHFDALYRLLRCTLHLRQLGNPRTGGISSYTLRAMIAVWYARGMFPASAAEQLLAFLAFWSSLDTTKYGVSAETGLFLKHPDDPQCWTYRRAAFKRGDAVRGAQWELCSYRFPYVWMLCLQNPCFRGSDLGKYAFAFKHVQRTFEYLYIKLRKGMVALDAGSEIQGSLLSPFVGSFTKALGKSKQRRRRGFEEIFDTAGD